MRPDSRLTALIALTAAVMLAMPAYEASAASLTSGIGGGVTVIDGIAVTGLNRRLGQPVLNLGALGVLGFTWIFGYNPGGEDPLPLTSSTPLDTPLATGVDLTYLSFFGLTRDDIDPTLINAPLHDVPTIADFAGNRELLPSVLEVTGGVRSRSLPNGPVTLGDWLAANGKALIACHEDGTADLQMLLHKLIPNGLYIIVGIFSYPGNALDAIPLGGAPSLVVADPSGEARFLRLLNFCPTNQTSAEKLLFIQVEYLSDGAAFGAVPHQALAPNPLPSGVTSHAQMNFPVAATVLN